MSWPQWVMIALIIVSLAGQCVGVVQNRRLSSGGATVACFAWTTYYGLFVLLLHAGGFW